MKKKEMKKKTSKKKVMKRTLDLKNDREIAMDFGVKLYQKFDKMIKSIVLFGSSVKNTATSSSDVDLVVIIDDAAIQWDQELISWYREELGKLVDQNRYTKELHITTIKMTTWWNDLLKGDPVITNMIRYGEAVVDFGGFFNPLKILLEQGRIKPTPESIYTALQRAPDHFRRSKIALLGSIDGLFWAMVDSSQAALMAYKVSPPSPEQIPLLLKETFVDTKVLKMDYVTWFRDLYVLHKKIVHGETNSIKGSEIDLLMQRTDNFIGVMAELVKKSII